MSELWEPEHTLLRWLLSAQNSQIIITEISTVKISYKNNLKLKYNDIKTAQLAITFFYIIKDNFSKNFKSINRIKMVYMAYSKAILKK